MMLLGLLFSAESNITSQLFSVSSFGFQYCVGFSTSSYLCVILSFLMMVPDIFQNYCINTNPYVIFTPDLVVSAYHLQTERLGERS